MRDSLKTRAAVGFSCVLLVASANTGATEGEDTEPRFALGVFLGYTRAHGDNEPTIGIEGGVNINKNWSAGLVIEQVDREESSTLVLAGLGWHPNQKVRLQLGLGRKDPSGENEMVIRTGIAYEFELAHHWFVKPYAAYDFIKNEENEPVVGFYFGRGF